MLPIQFKHIFTKTRTALIILLCYFLGFLIALPTYFDCCRTLMLPGKLGNFYEDPETWSASIYCSDYFRDFRHQNLDLVLNIVIQILMITSYIVILQKVWRNGKIMASYKGKTEAMAFSERAPEEHKISKKELRILGQVGSEIAMKNQIQAYFSF